jgi:5-methylcytosine-specific restriction endonuclease McrA
MNREYFNNRRNERRQEFIRLLGGKCAICGSTKNLHFDHINPSTKSFRISIRIDAPKDLLLEELDKCQLLCSKCHKRKTLENDEFGSRSAHGTIWRYKKYKCRCKKCRKAMSDYNRKRRKALLKAIKDDINS